jgi:hypothetical protein
MDRTGVPPDGSGLDPAAWSLRDFAEATPSSMAMFDTGMRYLAVSPQLLIDNKIAETQQSIVGRSVFEFRRDSTEAREVNRRVLSGETIVKEGFFLPPPRRQRVMDAVTNAALALAQRRCRQRL